ncbi:MAG: phosphopyruvate hydratase [Candidatus Vogelbacteria bacterium CG10_big_fil_rev_8_21_14_0_10_49_38]|uniref:Enolase n=1 Tax=Candidatus Vogelbacteria bacterium CG10_big_fil_rev_8_21_14_0_10_49_38 TaxID=1975043 RepID=A0A2H0RHJ5_9BACT|nr:MAG: phosphopyruvate hydratase [bacterium CG10_49_38]PIR46032.1 MAG: phosphopyruvate hydratase [Candidatus Vogelbacteria bacterium CG10_big_fil_rev_8_21_14_0_10_49_38]
MVKIEKIEAREILDSRGNPTIEAEVILAGAIEGKSPAIAGRAAVPSGASTGVHEARELRDGDPDYHQGLGVSRAIANVNVELAGALVGREFDQAKLDETMIDLDGTANKERLGANAILSVSLAFARAAASEAELPLYRYLRERLPRRPVYPFPIPMFNILNGGRHADSVDWQEFMAVPIGAENFAEGFNSIKAVYASLKTILETKGWSTEIGDEGGFAPKLAKNTEALDLIISAIKAAGYEPEREVALALDVAASEFKNGKVYQLAKEGGRELTAGAMIDWYEELIRDYPIISIEDGLAQDDWADWQMLTARLGAKINLVGDDLLVTNPTRLKQSIEQKAANAILIKPNQIGTLTETIKVIELAQTAGYQTVISHRSGETQDSFIADLAVGVGADFIKAGAPARPERLAKYERLLEIEQELS